ncbi:MAG: anthranilate phosphoribosyltransferase [Pseudomonadota bacterium]
MDMPGAIRAVTDGRDLTEAEMETTMRTIMTGDATQAQIGGFLIGLRMKGETVAEIAAAARVMRELATGVKARGEHVVDVVGTGGDGTSTFNISTTSSFIVAACGGQVAKHGNRSVSSRSGAADLLEAAGVRLDLSPESIARCVDEVGVGFMFAPNHHGAMRHAIGPRREMAVRTVFNLLGPLTNPAGAPNQLLGVFSAEWVQPVAEVLSRLGSNHVLVVHSEDGLDEVSLGAPTHVAELKDGVVSTFTIEPESYGFARSPLETVAVQTVEQSLSMVRAVLANEDGPPRDIALLNAGAAIYAANLSDSIADGIELARQALARGDAAARLEQLAALSQQLAPAA